MKATGIVRRIDDLGRVVIPKEIRRTLRIREGEPLEIFTDREGEIILKKYSPIGEISNFAKEYAESLSGVLGTTVCITDQDKIVATAGYGKKELSDQLITENVREVIEERKQFIAYANERKFVPVTEEMPEGYLAEVIQPILCEGDVPGCVIMLERHEKKKIDEVSQKLLICAADFLGRRMQQ